MDENKKKLFIYNKKVNVINMIDQNHLNNGGHNEYTIVKIDGYKSKQTKYCVIEYDIYGKEKSYFLTKDKLVEEFGDDVLKKN